MDQFDAAETMNEDLLAQITAEELYSEFDQESAEMFLAQIEAQQLPSAANPIAQAKESMNELKQMVQQADAKAMGYAEYNVFKKLRTLFRKKSKHAEHVFQQLKKLLKDGWDGHKPKA